LGHLLLSDHHHSLFFSITLTNYQANQVTFASVFVGMVDRMIIASPKGKTKFTEKSGGAEK
jgi:hypothetical protein